MAGLSNKDIASNRSYHFFLLEESNKKIKELKKKAKTIQEQIEIELMNQKMIKQDIKNLPSMKF